MLKLIHYAAVVLTVFVTNDAMGSGELREEYKANVKLVPSGQIITVGLLPGDAVWTLKEKISATPGRPGNLDLTKVHIDGDGMSHIGNPPGYFGNDYVFTPSDLDALTSGRAYITGHDYIRCERPTQA